MPGQSLDCNSSSKNSEEALGFPGPICLGLASCAEEPIFYATAQAPTGVPGFLLQFPVGPTARCLPLTLHA